MQIEYKFHHLYPQHAIQVRISGGFNPSLNKWKDYTYQEGYRFICNLHAQTDWPIIDVTPKKGIF